jgi:hypothetical protein
MRAKRLSKGDAETREKVLKRGVCELSNKIPQVLCIGPLTDHHVKKRTYGETRHDEELHLCLCLNHHQYLHYHPAFARKNGWIIDSKSRLLEEPPTLLHG